MENIGNDNGNDNDNDNDNDDNKIGSHAGGSSDGVGKVSTSPEEDSSVFDSFGVLEHILSFVDTQTLLNATLVTRRFKKAARHDDLWVEAIKRLWKDKKGVYYHTFSQDGVTSSSSTWTKPRPSQTTSRNPNSRRRNPQDQPKVQQPYNNLIFWRSLFAKELVEKMTEEQIRCFLFGHPLLEWKSNQFEQQLSSTSPTTTRCLLLQRFAQLHMLDIMSDLTSEEVQQSVFSSVFGGNDGDESGLNVYEDDDEDTDNSNVSDSDDNEDNEFDDEDGDMINTRQQQRQREQEQRRQLRSQRQRALPRRHFFSDLYFGSYACSVMDSHRCRLTQLELCRPYGWLLYFKVDANELLEDLLEHPSDDDDDDDDDVGGGDGEILLDLVDEEEDNDHGHEHDRDEEDDDDDDGDFNYAHAAARRRCLEVYEKNPRILLYKHSVCYFDPPEGSNGGVCVKDGTSTQRNDFFGNTNRGRKFRMEVLEHVENIVSSDLQWRWAVNGCKVQVSPYPPLKVQRRSDDWGWELENQHVVMRSLEYDRQHPEPRHSLPEVFLHAIADAESERNRRRQRRRRRHVRGRHR